MISKVAILLGVTFVIGQVESLNLCKVYLGGKLYNIEPILPAIHLDLNQNVWATANLCSTVSLEKYEKENFTIVKPEEFANDIPNSIIINNQTKTVYCITFFNNYGKDFWRASLSNWPMLAQAPSKAVVSGDFTNSSQEIVVQSVELSNNDKVSSIKFKFKCERDPTYVFRDFYFDKSLKEILYAYTGPDACPLDLPDYVVFFSNNVFFLGILFCSSAIGLFLGRKWERLAMSLTSLQAAVMITSAFLIASTHSHNFKQYVIGKERYFGLALISVSFLLFGLSYFSRLIAVVFVCVSVSYSVTWTMTYLATLLLESRISFMILGISTGVLLLLIASINCTYSQLRERYSFGVYTALTNPFFMVMSIGIYSGYYLDVITFNQYSDWGKVDSVSWKSWTPLALQVLLTAILIAKSCFEAASEERVRSSTNFKLLTERLNEDKNLFKNSEIDVQQPLPTTIIQM